jgi:flagellar biosynthesis/type III secretory pathway chaperone
MDSLLTKLIGLLEEETGLYRSLLFLLQEEKRAFSASALEDLTDAGKEKENQILKIRILEEQRVRMIEGLADRMGRSFRDLTLSRLIRMVDEPFAARLTDCRSNLISLVQSIRELNESNGAQIEHSLGLVRGSLALLNNIIPSNPVYHRTGTLQGCGHSGRLLSGEV